MRCLVVVCPAGVSLGAWIGKLTQLENVTLDGIIADEIPSWIGELTRLENLMLDGSTHDSAENHNSVLTHLPISMGDMERLNTITLSNFIRLRELPETLGSLSSIQKLDLRGCDALVTLPTCLDQWTGMECLTLNNMPKFKELPPNMAVNKNLHTLYIIMCVISKIPESIGALSMTSWALTNLKQLVMESCLIMDLPP